MDTPNRGGVVYLLVAPKQDIPKSALEKSRRKFGKIGASTFVLAALVNTLTGGALFADCKPNCSVGVIDLVLFPIAALIWGGIGFLLGWLVANFVDLFRHGFRRPGE